MRHKVAFQFRPTDSRAPTVVAKVSSLVRCFRPQPCAGARAVFWFRPLKLRGSLAAARRHWRGELESRKCDDLEIYTISAVFYNKLWITKLTTSTWLRLRSWCVWHCATAGLFIRTGTQGTGCVGRRFLSIGCQIFSSWSGTRRSTTKWLIEKYRNAQRIFAFTWTTIVDYNMLKLYVWIGRATSLQSVFVLLFRPSRE